MKSAANSPSKHFDALSLQANASLLYLGQLAVVFLAYFATGYLGLKAPTVGSNITLIWLPTGIAVAAMLKWGLQVWPAISIGAFFVSFSVGMPAHVAALIAVGNTLAPTLSTLLLRKTGFDNAFPHRRDALLLIIAAMSGMILSATGGVLALWTNGFIPDEVIRHAWHTWWFGDAVGVLIATPPLITLSRKNLPELTNKPIEAAAFVTTLVLVNWFIFMSPFGRFAIAFIPIPITIWAAMRFSVSGASCSVVVSSLIAAYGTATGHGPFSASPPDQAQMMLWAFISTQVLVSLDTTALLAGNRRAMGELKLHSEILHNMNEGVQLTRVSDSVIVYTNPTFDKMFGYQAGELIGKHVSRLNAQREKSPQRITEEINLALEQDGNWTGEILNAKKDGNSFWCQVAISVFDHHELGPVWVAVHGDITQRKEAEEKIHFLAFYDPLTELPNRRLLLERVRHIGASGKRNKHHAALLFIDLDHFKLLNDTRGHNIGDMLLIEVAKRLKESVREGDTVARLGGDEFVVVLPSLSERVTQAASSAYAIAEKIRESLSRDYVLDNLTYCCSSSIGIELFREASADVNETLKRADTAMYKAKSAGRNTACFFNTTYQPVTENVI